ncbi:MAG: hypothetical protein ACWA47_03135, partial [Brevirhabdus sp.]
MFEFLPKDVRDGLEQARKRALRKSSRLRVKVGDEMLPILSFEDNGFTMDAETTPKLRGLVDIYHGGRHIYQCLIVASSLEDGNIRYEFKRNTQALDKAPLDFYREPDAPIA